jgi:exodeoxyribonuclease V alpha subunit
MPILEAAESAEDFFFVERGDPEGVLAAIRSLVGERIPRRFGLDPVEEIQVLTPMHKGLLGAASLNGELQALLNPANEALTRGGRTLRTGDKVMQIRNNYDLEVFNGDIGRIERIGSETHEVLVRYDDRRVAYKESDLDELVLAYACSIHKAQGSEYPCVVVPVHTQHYVMLQRNLLYTAMTRGKRLVVLVGSKRALGIAVRNAKVADRHTRLVERLRRLAPR